MSDVQVKVDILPVITPDAIKKAVNAAATGAKLDIKQVEIMRSALQSALDTATAGLELKIGGVKLDNASQLGGNIAKTVQDGYQRASKKSGGDILGVGRSQRDTIKQLAGSLGPLESRLKKLGSLGFDGWKMNKLTASLQGAEGKIRGLSSATSSEFKKMSSAARKEIKAIESSISKGEKEIQQRLMGSMKPVTSMYGTLSNKMSKSGITGKQSSLDSAYQKARSLTEREVAAKMSGDVSGAAALGNAAKQARESFLSLGREIESDFNAVNKLQRTLASLETKHSILGEDPNADVTKLAELESKLNEVKSLLGQMGSASGGEFDKLRVDAEGAAQSAEKLASNIKTGAKDITSDLRSVYTLLEKIDKIERSGSSATSDPALSGRLTNMKKQAEDMVNAGIGSREAINRLQNSYKGWERDAGNLGHNLNGGNGPTSRIASLFKNVTGAMVFYEAFNKAKQAARAMYESVVSVDNAMTQLKIVTGASGSEMSTFFKEAATSATELGHSVSEVLGSIETFSRLGYNLNDAMSLSNAATMMSNVAAVSVDESTTGLTSIIKGYGLQASDASDVSDKLTAVGQDYAVSASELMEALERGGSSLASANNTLDESIALIAAGNASVQDAASVGG